MSEQQPSLERPRRASLETARRHNRRRQRLIILVRAVYRLGERATFELVDQIARETKRRPIVERVAEEIATLNPVALQITGGDRFPPAIFAVAHTMTSGL